MSIIGCYTLDLYCENSKVMCGMPDELGHVYNEFPHQYISEMGSTARREARQDGWKLDMEAQTALCPRCSGKKPK